MSNPVNKYNNYIKNTLFLIFLLYVILFFYDFNESYRPRIIDYFKIVGYILNIILFIMELYGFILFINSKYFIRNEDNKDKTGLFTYIPWQNKKLFNPESFILSMEIVKIILEIL